MATNASVATGGGGLASFVVAETASASLSVFQAKSTAACGSGGLLASATPKQSSLTVVPITTSGWLNLAFSASGAGVIGVTAAVGLVPPGGSDVSTYLFIQQSVGSVSRQVYLPAGWSVAIQLNVSADASLRNPIDSRRSASVSATLRGTVTPVGAAVTGERGKRLARHAVALPGAVSCSTGRAGVRLTKVAKKKASSVTFLVNGHKARRLKRIKRARSLAIRVPTAGAITITAKVTPKHGKKVKVRRSYAACR
ncbi:hypothetical protein [Nocardioides terrae]|nr:hypothetical protein [Nocardioides terrae]